MMNISNLNTNYKAMQKGSNVLISIMLERENDLSAFVTIET